MFKVCEGQCDQCLFSKDKIVDDNRMRDILTQCAKMDTHFICHKATINGEDVCCKGFYDTQTSNLMRIAKHRGMVEFVPVPAGDND